MSRNQITLWGPKGEILDYACKQWARKYLNVYNSVCENAIRGNFSFNHNLKVRPSNCN